MISPDKKDLTIHGLTSEPHQAGASLAPENLVNTRAMD
jgi:hypothetical protein